MSPQLNYIHYFRALAIIFIVLGHSIDIFDWPDGSELERWLRIFISNGSALFVFIAGYLFQHLLVRFDAKKYYKNKLTNVLLPYLIVSIPAIIIFTFILERDGVPVGLYDSSYMNIITYFILTGRHLAPLWFIPMIAIFFMVAVPLKNLDKSKVFYMLLPIFILISCFIPRGGMPYQYFAHFFSIYMLGMFCSHYKAQINDIIAKPSFLTVTVSLVIAFAFSEFYYTTRTMTWLNFLQKCFASIFFLGLLYKFNDKLTSKLLSKVADYSFGVFFIHSYIISFGKVLYAHLYDEPVRFHLILYVACILLTFAICLLIVDAAKLIFKSRSRYLVGS